MYKNLAIVLILFNTMFAVSVAQNLTETQYNLDITIKELSFNSNTAVVDVRIEAQVLPGNGFVYILLPFTLLPSGTIITDSSSDETLILFGDLLPLEQSSILQISLGNEAANIQILLTNASLLLDDTPKSESGKAITLLFKDSTNKAQTFTLDSRVVPLTSVSVRANNIESSEPLGQMSRTEDTYSIDLSAYIPKSTNLIFYLAAQIENPWIIPAIFFVLGIPAPAIGVIGFVKSKRAAVLILCSTLILSTVVSVLLFHFWPYISLSTDISNILGGAVGLVIGLFVSSIYVIRKTP
jgi:hypothetical protein